LLGTVAVEPNNFGLTPQSDSSLLGLVLLPDPMITGHATHQDSATLGSASQQDPLSL